MRWSLLGIVLLFRFGLGYDDYVFTYEVTSSMLYALPVQSSSLLGKLCQISNNL